MVDPSHLLRSLDWTLQLDEGKERVRTDECLVMQRTSICLAGGRLLIRDLFSKVNRQFATFRLCPLVASPQRG